MFQAFRYQNKIDHHREKCQVRWASSGGGTSEGENCWISFLFHSIFGWWNWGWWPWFGSMISDISVQKSLYAESEPEVQNHLPTWAQQTLSSAGDNIGNPDDPRRTWSDFQRVGIVLSCFDNLLSYPSTISKIILPCSKWSEMASFHGWRDEFSSRKHYLGASFSSSWKEIGSNQVGVLKKGCCWWNKIQI